MGLWAPSDIQFVAFGSRPSSSSSLWPPKPLTIAAPLLRPQIYGLIWIDRQTGRDTETDCDRSACFTMYRVIRLIVSRNDCSLPLSLCLSIQIKP